MFSKFQLRTLRCVVALLMKMRIYADRKTRLCNIHIQDASQVKEQRIACTFFRGLRYASGSPGQTYQLTKLMFRVFTKFFRTLYLGVQKSRSRGVHVEQRQAPAKAKPAKKLLPLKSISKFVQKFANNGRFFDFSANLRM